LEKLEIPKTYDDINENSEEEKAKLRIIDLNELAHKELLLSIDEKRNSRKTTLKMING
jgi:hypothetical protein